MNKKRLGVLLVFIIIIFFAIGAIILKIRSSGTGPVVTYKPRVYAFGPISEEHYLKDALAAYKEDSEDPIVDLRVVPLAPPQTQTGDFVAGYEYLLLADFTAKDPPDIFTLNVGRVPAYIENNALLDLSPYLESDYKKIHKLPQDEPIYSLPYYEFVDLVVAFSTLNPQKSVDLAVYLSSDRILRDSKLAQEAFDKAYEAAKEGGGILDVPDESGLYTIWNNMAISYGNNQILIDEDAKDDNYYLISHEQAYGYPYMTLKFDKEPQTGAPRVLLVFNDQYLENPTLKRNMEQAILVLIRSIHAEIDEIAASQILNDLFLNSDQTSLMPDLENIQKPQTTSAKGYEFAVLIDPLSRALQVTKLP